MYHLLVEHYMTLQSARTAYSRGSCACYTHSQFHNNCILSVPSYERIEALVGARKPVEGLLKFPRSAVRMRQQEKRAGRHLRLFQRYGRRFQDLCHVTPCRLGEWDPTFRRMLAFPSLGSSRLGIRPFAMTGNKLHARRQHVAAQHLDPANGVLTSQLSKCHSRLSTKTHVSCACSWIYTGKEILHTKAGHRAVTLALHPNQFSHSYFNIPCN